MYSGVIFTLFLKLNNDINAIGSRFSPLVPILRTLKITLQKLQNKPI